MSLTQTSRACPLRFILFLCLFLSLWPFQLYFSPYNYPHNSLLSHSVLPVLSALSVLQTIYLFKKIFNPDIILCGWLGLKHQLTFTYRQFTMNSILWHSTWLLDFNDPSTTEAHLRMINDVHKSVHILTLFPYVERPRGITFSWWGCYGLCLRHKLTKLASLWPFQLYFIP